MIYSTTPTSNFSAVSNSSALSGQLPQQIFTRREVIPHQNDVLWRIEYGAVRTLTWSEDGTFITLGYWGLGDLIGYPLSRVKPYQIECLTGVELSIVPPHLWHQDINALLSHIQQAEDLLSIVHQKPISLRLWQFLVWLSEKFDRDVDKGKLIDLNVTHQDIAEVLNTTRVTITRILQQLEEEGTVLRYKRRIILRLPSGKLIKNYGSAVSN
ncbi:replication/maintenance protein [Nostoc sp. 'Peltigera membranacea cyanobiont' 213]|uniref:Crp/Fnr family transcriptional regulator n=1 Tax=Nostoc sp. 'Peltigera membranacea cyanobiont' 213 TaxID=2014530 RepID=UPI000B95072F|nr:Crp/Fnr family transcriptional regulator [Nostoc sp. 'Peltigera membranacea cyanobiont' 213]OYD91395.1 replication/maintenance protein [Nostoc sp. 'Peltigera membranacea cyanobiont' 213]